MINEEQEHARRLSLAHHAQTACAPLLQDGDLMIVLVLPAQVTSRQQVAILCNFNDPDALHQIFKNLSADECDTRDASND